jgi:osmotically-inducible protein OsmY
MGGTRRVAPLGSDSSYNGTAGTRNRRVVMLEGTVGSAAEKELAAQDARKVKGVLDVHNGLEVR